MSEVTAKGLAILGDSYSTFPGYNPAGHHVYYENGANGVQFVEQTWWQPLLAEFDLRLVINDSYSGSTVCHRGYDGVDATSTSFLTRATQTLNSQVCMPDVILIFGGTNDYCAKVPLGTPEGDDHFAFLPAYQALLRYLQVQQPQARLLSVINGHFIDQAMWDGVQAVTKALKVQTVVVHGFDMHKGHPDVAGMQTIAKQVAQALRA